VCDALFADANEQQPASKHRVAGVLVSANSAGANALAWFVIEPLESADARSNGPLETPASNFAFAISMERSVFAL
jgi:hypothetical protein